MSHIIVCGLGEVGYRIVNLLLDLGEKVTVVSLASRDEWIDIVKARGAEVVVGDARNENILVKAGLDDALSVIACTHNDSANIEISLDVKRLFPQKRTIARIVDPNLARQAEKHLKVHRAIAMTAAAAPTFAAATYGDEVLSEFTVRDERRIALRVEGPQKLHETPLVVISANGECLEERREISEGETAIVISDAKAIAEQVPKRKRRHSLLRALSPVGIAKFVAGVWSNTSIQLRAVLLVIGALIVISVAVFAYAMKLPIVDALYFVVTTATTVGYGDITPKDASSWLKLYTCFMMIVSATGLAVLFSVVTDYILTARLMQLVGRHRIPDHGHVLVLGVGAVGHRVVEELTRLGAHVVAIERDENGEYLSTLRSKVHVIIGDGREPEVLLRAGARHAKALIATAASDAVNLSVGLAAKEINPDLRVVLSIFDADFAATIQSIDEIDAALSPPLLAAPTFVGAALYEDAVASFKLNGLFFTLTRDPHGKLHHAGEHMSLQIRPLVNLSK